MSFPTVYYITQVIPSCYSAGYAMCVCVSFGACVYRSLDIHENRQDSAKRTEKTAHAFDIVEILKKLDKNKETPTFVIDSFDLAKLPRINTENITYVSVAEKVAELDAKNNLMNDAIASNTVRSTNNSEVWRQLGVNTYAVQLPLFACLQ